MTRQPNILWYCTDQQRWDTIRALGQPHIETPTLDWLCANGVAFNRAYSQSQICTPARASFLTGATRHRTMCIATATRIFRRTRSW
ncbi:MAG: sulfatase-like hydrolase/transferase [Betaproteobacteria bacterium]|nr:sulfatase-like hydrolase/transferase [Betaproteobacteria bacterium]